MHGLAILLRPPPPFRPFRGGQAGKKTNGGSPRAAHRELTQRTPNGIVWTLLRCARNDDAGQWRSVGPRSGRGHTGATGVSLGLWAYQSTAGVALDSRRSSGVIASRRRAHPVGPRSGRAGRASRGGHVAESLREDIQRATPGAAAKRPARSAERVNRRARQCASHRSGGGPRRGSVSGRAQARAAEATEEAWVSLE